LGAKSFGNRYAQTFFTKPERPNLSFKSSRPLVPPVSEKEINIRTKNNIAIKIPKDNSYFETENVVDVFNKWIVIKAGKHYSKLKSKQKWNFLYS